jgi:hypothetical protein
MGSGRLFQREAVRDGGCNVPGSEISEQLRQILPIKDRKFYREALIDYNFKSERFGIA